MKKLKVLELFGGIRACSKALERLRIDYECVDYVEIDKYAVASSNAIYNTNYEPQDIRKWDKNIEVDLIMHGSPCQDFSLAGKGAGANEGSSTRSSLMYETIRIVGKLKPKYVVWENVKNLLSKKHKHNFEAYLEKMEKLGYKNYYQVLNAKNFGIPQNRERIFTISIRKDVEKEYVFPKPFELKLRLKDMLEDEVDEKYYLSDKTIENISATRTTNENYDELNDNFDSRLLIKEATKKGYVEAKEGDGVYINRPHQKRGVVQKGMIQTLKTSPDVGVVVKGKINKNSTEKTNELIVEVKKGKYDSNTAYGKYLFQSSMFDDKPLKEIIPTLKSTKVDCGVIYKLRIRKLTPKEYWRLMGFDDNDIDKAAQVVSNTQLYKQAGNSIAVNVLECILTNLLLNNSPQYEKPTYKEQTIFDFIE